MSLSTLSQYSPFSIVPEELLDYILKWANPPEKPEHFNYFGLKTTLQLAGVCQKWRVMVLHHPIAHAAIQRLPPDTCQGDGNHSFHARTNLAVILSLKKAQSVTDLTIYLDDMCWCKPQLEEIMDLLEKDGDHVWPGVKSLVFVGRGIFASGNTPEDAPYNNQKSLIACNRFIGMFPNITSITQIDKQDSPHTLNVTLDGTRPVYAFYERLFQYYRYNLTFMQGVPPLRRDYILEPAKATTSFVLHARHLEKFTDNTCVLAKIIRQLVIYNIDNGVQWDWFAHRRSQSKKLSFENLVKLHLQFTMRAPLSEKLDPSGGYTLYFPVLRDLLVFSSCARYDDLYNLFRQSPIEKLTVEEKIENLRFVSTEIFSTAKRVWLFTAPYEDSIIRLPGRAISRIYRLLHTVQQLSLFKSSYSLTGIQHLVGLVNLEINLAEDEIPYLRLAIPQLPKLKYLDVMQPRSQQLQTRRYVFEPDSKRPAIEDPVSDSQARPNHLFDTEDLKPLSHRLEHLRIAKGGMFVYRQTRILIRSLPSLVKVDVQQGNFVGIASLNKQRGGVVSTNVYTMR